MAWSILRTSEGSIGQKICLSAALPHWVTKRRQLGWSRRRLSRKSITEIEWSLYYKGRGPSARGKERRLGSSQICTVVGRTNGRIGIPLCPSHLNQLMATASSWKVSISLNRFGPLQHSKTKTTTFMRKLWRRSRRRRVYKAITTQLLTILVQRKSLRTKL